MKILKKLSFFAVSGLMLMQMFPVSAYAESSDFRYTLKPDGTAEISCINTQIETAEIPSEIDGHKITALAENCFADCTQLREEQIP